LTHSKDKQQKRAVFSVDMDPTDMTMPKMGARSARAGPSQMIKIQPDTETRQVCKTGLQIEQIERVKEWAITRRKQK
jgi:hypothetical protein